MTTSQPPAINSAIIGVIRALPAIGKDRKVTGGGPSYQYRGIEDILPHLKTAFVEKGVHVAPSYRLIADQTYTVKSGAEWRRVMLEGTYRFVCDEDGSSVEVTTIGEATDSGDKATNKAMTAAYKYAIIQTFALTEADDPDATSSAESESHPVPTRPPDGHITVVEAKKMFLEACEGDVDCARDRYQGAALSVVDEHFVAEDAVHEAVRAIVAEEGS